MNDRTVLQAPTWASTIYCEACSEQGRFWTALDFTSLSAQIWQQTGNHYVSVITNTKYMNRPSYPRGGVLYFPLIRLRLKRRFKFAAHGEQRGLDERAQQQKARQCHPSVLSGRQRGLDERAQRY